MFFTAQMRYLQIIVLEKDFQKTIDLLGDFGWLEIKNGKENEEKKEKFEEMNQKLDTIEGNIITITEFFGVERSFRKGHLRNILAIEKDLRDLNEKIKPKQEEFYILAEKKKELENGLKELNEFKDLKITKKELDSLNFLYFTIGSLIKKDLDILLDNMKGRLSYLELSKDLYILFTSKKGKWTLESELKKIHFKEKQLPFEDDVLPNELYLKINEELRSTEEKINKIELFMNDLKKKEIKELNQNIESFNLQKIYQNVYQTIKHSGATTTIEGWILKKDRVAIKEKIHDLLGNRVSMISYDPNELEEVKTGKLKVPVLMDNSPVIKPFEKLVFNYGAPLYGSIDPTFFVAISFLLLFGLMFGDMGQGLIIMLVGIFLRKSKRISKFRDSAPILIYAGIFAMIFGYLYGAAFCFEHEHLEHFLKPINKTLFNIDAPYIINITINDISSIMNLFILTVSFGIVINLLGIALNIINNFSKKKIGEALFARTGIAGFIMLLSLAILLYRVIIFSQKPPSFLVVLIITSVSLIILKNPLDSIISKNKKLFHHGFGMWLLHSVVELIELILSTMSNNLSFIRVGAFAFAHVLLSVTTLKLAEAIGGSIVSIGGILIIIFGNLLIITLEGMIVTIQTIRLEYYEFFSKFFTEIGKKFIPFKIEKNNLEDIQ